MKQELKTQLTRGKIIDAAIKEFGRYGYEKASLNNVCTKYGLSKGVIYHNFKDKNEIYLSCLKICFDALTDYLDNSSQTPNYSLVDYFTDRQRFFNQNPDLYNIFQDSLFNSPLELAEAIKELRMEFDAINQKVLVSFIENTNLRPGVTEEKVIELFNDYLEFITIRNHKKHATENSEELCKVQLEFFLYGILGVGNENK